MELYIFMEVYMNTLKKIMLAVLILGASAQTLNAHPWTTKTIATTTLAGLGFGFVAVKYYGFNTITNAVLEKCANAKNWFSNKLSDVVYGSHNMQIQKLNAQRTRLLEEKIEEEAILKQEIKEVLEQKDNDRKNAHERAINLTKQIMEQNKTLKTLKIEKERIEDMMRKNVDGLHTRSIRNESEAKKLQAIVSEQEQTIAYQQAMLTQMQEKLAGVAVPSDEETSESDSVQQNIIE